MTKEQIDSILAEVGITFNAKNNAVFNGVKIDDAIANGLLKAHNVTIEQIRTELRNLANQPVEIPDGLRYKDMLSEMEVVSPAFTNDIKWNKMDEELFSFFSFAKASAGSAPVLLISNLDTEYRSVPLSNNSLSNLADITEACASISYTDENGVKRTLYDYINYKMEQILKEALAVYQKATAVEFGAWASRKGLPSMMLNNYKLYTVHEAVEIEQQGGSKTTMYRPLSLGFKESPLQCLASHYDTIMGVPSRKAKMPKLYSNDINEPAMYHIDLDSIVDDSAPHPTWDHYMKRFSEYEAKAFRAFIWSIFDASNTGRQMLYIYDPDGFSGKSVVANAIAQCLGEHLVAAIQKDSLINQFGLEKVYNKRLVIIDDNKNPNLIRSEKMHQITGGGLGDIEPKGKKSFTYRFQCKVMASGNTRLNIDPYAQHERTRVIVIQPKLTDEMLKEFAVCDENGNIVRNRLGMPKLIGDPGFERRLIEEFNSFLGDCRRDYEEVCPSHSSIRLNADMEETLDNMSDDDYDIFDEIVDRHFVVGPECKTTLSDFNAAFRRVMFELQMSIGKKKIERLTEENLTQHMVKRFHLVKKSIWVDKRTAKGYVGIEPSKSAPKEMKVDSSKFNANDLSFMMDQPDEEVA